MKIISNIKSKDKSGLHPRNKHRSQYDFSQLTSVCSDLKQFISKNKYNTETIDFTNDLAVKTLNQALLKQFYNIEHWDIPKKYLCPPIPGRVDYIHNIADVLSLSNSGIIPKGKSVHVLDIGVGANCIYPLLGHQVYDWQFVGTDSDLLAVKVATQIIESNSLSNYIEIRHQKNTDSIFNGVLKPQEVFDITMCNPPFHSSAKEAQAGTEKKWKNLGYIKTVKPVLNFGGQNSELWCNGGEVVFITKMVEESSKIQDSSLWFTSLVSKSNSLPSIYFALKKAGAVSIKTINMTQGNKVSRMVAWTFLNDMQHIQWSLKRWKD